MADPEIREYLIGYLLDALDEDEQRLVEESLAVDESLRRELGLMSKALAPLDAIYEEHSPPPNLTAKTCEMVDAYREGILSEETVEKPVRAKLVFGELVSAKPLNVEPAVEVAKREEKTPSRPSKFTGQRRMHPVSSVPRAKVTDWRWQDLAVSALVIGLILITLVPGLLSQREDARVLACQNNLGSLGNSLTEYSECNNGFFPPIPTSGKMSVASAFGPILAGAELLPNPHVLLCPDSSFSEKLLTENRNGQQGFVVPMPVEITQIESPAELLAMQRKMGGSYGYSLGYHQNGTYRPTRNLRRPYFAVLSDSPDHVLTSSQVNYQPSHHHGGRGQNVLFEDGHVFFITQTRAAGGRDNLFLNDANQIAAGLHPNDAVIAAGAVRP